MNEAPYFFQFPLLLYLGWKPGCSSASTPCFFIPFGRFFLSLQTQMSSQEEGRRSTYCCNLEEPYSGPILICLVPCSEISFAVCTHPLVQVPWSFQLSLFHQDLALPASPALRCRQVSPFSFGTLPGEGSKGCLCSFPVEMALPSSPTDKTDSEELSF